MRSNKLNVRKKLKFKHGGSMKKDICNGYKKGKDPKCVEQTGCKWVPKKGRVLGKCVSTENTVVSGPPMVNSKKKKVQRLVTKKSGKKKIIVKKIKCITSPGNFNKYTSFEEWDSNSPIGKCYMETSDDSDNWYQIRDTYLRLSEEARKFYGTNIDEYTSRIKHLKNVYKRDINDPEILEMYNSNTKEAKKKMKSELKENIGEEIKAAAKEGINIVA
jgi:hypothetical protein